LEESWAKSPLDENTVIYLASSSKENFNLGEPLEKGLHWTFQMLPLWLTRGNNGSPSQPLPFNLYCVALGGLNI